MDGEPQFFDSTIIKLVKNANGDWVEVMSDSLYPGEKLAREAGLPNVKALILRSDSGIDYRLVVSDSGTVDAVPVVVSIDSVSPGTMSQDGGTFTVTGHGLFKQSPLFCLGDFDADPDALMGGALMASDYEPTDDTSAEVSFAPGEYPAGVYNAYQVYFKVGGGFVILSVLENALTVTE